MYGNGPTVPAAAGASAIGAGFTISTTVGLLVAALTLLFALLALRKIAPKRRRQEA